MEDTRSLWRFLKAIDRRDLRSIDLVSGPLRGWNSHEESGWATLADSVARQR